jgi:hypothetical protein
MECGLLSLCNGPELDGPLRIRIDYSEGVQMYPGSLIDLGVAQQLVYVGDGRTGGFLMRGTVIVRQGDASMTEERKISKHHRRGLH